VLIINLNKRTVRGIPSASFAATNARGYPVAFEARADERERRAFTSMIQYSTECGFKAYWILHSPMMPKWRTTYEYER